MDLLAEVACIWEVGSRKPGNVYPGVSFPDTSAVDFILSAAAIRGLFRFPGSSGTGWLIKRAVEETRAAVGKNTNLGIIILLAPLANAFSPPLEFRPAVAKELVELTTDDARFVFEAIRLASPGGLGDAPEQDVREEPTVTLLEAMKLAADRDMVAQQYANGFADVFDFGLPAFLNAFERFGCVEAAIIDSQLCWLAKYPDSLIARKRGIAVAVEVQQRAKEVQALGGIATPEGRRAGVALDKHLRYDGNKLNPGTTADLITACLFVALRENKVLPSAPFRWNSPDWL
ncbi:MAG: triphosphoribosyl-dephospho-CoA synthetase [Planctomycetaceae bacterium]|nr:triphosphoribosyl-dephospho-CoA synthetase [Planctomycetaceae bacterium]